MKNQIHYGMFTLFQFQYCYREFYKTDEIFISIVMEYADNGDLL